MPRTIEVPVYRPLQPEFVALVDDARNSLCQVLGASLDSLYLYGSVARSCARPGQSDLDLTLVLSRPLAPQEQDALEQAHAALQARHPEVAKIDLDPGVRDEVLHPAHANSWGYWLRHECRCIYGADLGLRFPPFQPSRALAQAINGDYGAVLADYARRIAQAATPEALRRLQKEAARKLVRASNVLRPANDDYWPQTLEDYAGYFSRHYPEMAEPMAFFLVHATAPWASAEAFNTQLANLGHWMQQTQKAQGVVDND